MLLLVVMRILWRGRCCWGLQQQLLLLLSQEWWLPALL
jgi:hypothetical protein